MRTAAARTRRSRRRFLPGALRGPYCEVRASARAGAPRRSCRFAARFHGMASSLRGRVRRCVDRVVASAQRSKVLTAAGRLRRVQPTRRAVRAGQDDTRCRSGGCAPGLQFRARCCGARWPATHKSFVVRAASSSRQALRRTDAGRAPAERRPASRCGCRSGSNTPARARPSTAGDGVRGRPRAIRPAPWQGRQARILPPHSRARRMRSLRGRHATRVQPAVGPDAA